MTDISQALNQSQPRGNRKIRVGEGWEEITFPAFCVAESNGHTQP